MSKIADKIRQMVREASTQSADRIPVTVHLPSEFDPATGQYIPGKAIVRQIRRKKNVFADRTKPVPMDEELTPEQKKKVDKWVKPGSHDFSNHVFGRKSRIEVPLESSKPRALKAPKSIESHLSAHGYKIHDYKAGLAVDQHGRQTKIGKALGRTKAPDNLIKQFAGDKRREGSTHGEGKKLKVIISRHRHDIAGMSTDRGWTSCMNMDHGEYSDRLPHDVKKGTHVAYLVHHDDDKIKRPLARIALKPFVSDEKKVADRHTILRPETSTYGMSHAGFRKTVTKWAKNNFAMHPGKLYRRSEQLYDDGVGHATHAKDNKTMMAFADSGDHEKRMLAAEHGSKKVLDHLIASTPDIHKKLKTTYAWDEDFNQKHAQTASLRDTIISRGHKDHLDHFVNSKDERVRIRVAEHTKYKEHHDKLVGDKSWSVRRAVADTTKHVEHLDKLVGDKNEKVREAASSNPHLTVDHMHKLATDKNLWTRYNVAERAKDGKHTDVLGKMVKDNDREIRSDIAEYGHKPHLDHLVNDEDHNVRRAVAEHGHPEHLNKLVKDPMWIVRHTVAQKTTSAKHLKKLMKDGDWDVQTAAERRHNSLKARGKLNEELTPEQKQLADEWKQDAGKDSHSVSDHAFGNKDRIEIPLGQSRQQKVGAPKEIENHLSAHGYKIHDYEKGLVIDKHNRPTKIGRALSRTKAPDSLIKQFAGDKRREGATHKDEGLKVVISRHHHDVAGMSTDRGWTSCMNMDGGMYRNKLEYDIHHGTHVAYLVHHDDTDIKRPLARIAIKPYDSKMNAGGTPHTVLRPEQKTYGMQHAGFKKAVNSWAKKNFPLKPGKVYARPDILYHDSGPAEIFRKDHKTMSMMADSGSSHLEKLAAKFGGKKVHSRLMHSDDVYVRTTVAAYTKHKEHLDHLVNDKNEEVRAVVAKFSPHKEHHDKLYRDDSPIVRAAAAEHGHPEHTDKLIHDSYRYVATAALINSKTPQKHADELLQHSPNHVAANDGLAHAVATRASPHVITKFLKQHEDDFAQHRYLHWSIAARGIPEHLDHYAKMMRLPPAITGGESSHYDKKPDNFVARHMVKKGNADHIHAVMDAGHGPRLVDEIAEHGNAEHHDRLMKAPSFGTGSTMSVARYGSKATIDKHKLASHHESSVRATVASRGFKSHHDKLVNDENEGVRAVVARNAKHGPHLDKLVNDKSDYVRFALANGSKSKEHVEKLTADKSSDTRDRARFRLKNWKHK